MFTPPNRRLNRTPVFLTGETAAAPSDANCGDTLLFGSYEQDGNSANGAEPIEWIVLDKYQGKLLLLSKYGLDYNSYNTLIESVTWETCTLRTWLNEEFYAAAFNETEQEHIVTTKVKNEDNPEYGTEGGNDTEDKIFLLSADEAVCYLDECEEYVGEDKYSIPVEDSIIRVKLTEYAKRQALYLWEYWYLRTPGSLDTRVMLAGEGTNLNKGTTLLIDTWGEEVHSNNGVVVRPALWLDSES